MKRKVIKQGHNTLTITIPSKWAADHGIKAGSELEITENDKSLNISTNGSGSIPSTISIDIAGMNAPLIWRFISSAYRAGYDEIAVSGIGADKKWMYSALSYNTLEFLRHNTGTTTSSLNMSPIETVIAVVNRLIGVEIMEQRPDYCLIKDMGDVSDREFDNALRRIFILIKTMCDNVLEGLDGKYEGIKSLHIVDTNLDRFEDFCFRVLNKKGYPTTRKTCIMHSIIFTLEMIGDELKKIAMHMLNDKGKYTPKTKEIFLLHQKQFERYYKLFYKFDKGIAAEIYRGNNDTDTFNKKMAPTLNEHEIELLHHFKKIGIFILSLTELRIDLEF